MSENTLVIATSDHGMPFPRCKGQAYDYSNHIPLAIRWPRGIEGSRRVVEDYVSFADLAPTLLEAARIPDLLHHSYAITHYSTKQKSIRDVAKYL